MKSKLEQTESRIQAFQKKVAELTEKIDLVEEQSQKHECLKCSTDEERFEKLSKQLSDISELTSKAKDMYQAEDTNLTPELKNFFDQISEILSQWSYEIWIFAYYYCGIFSIC